jgi:hypothetical protein
MPLDALGLGYTAVASIDPTTGLPIGAPTPQAYTLLKNASATGQSVTNIRGGSYIWRISGTFGGGTATLQTLDLDGTTWVNARNQANTADVTATTASSIGVVIGQGGTVRVLLTGATGASLSSVLSGVA